MLGHEHTRAAGVLDRAQAARRRCASCRPRSASTSTPTRSSRTCRSACSSASRSSRRSSRDARGAHPRRADRGAHPAGDRRADARSCAQLADDGTSIVFITHKLREVARSPTASPSSAAARSSARPRPTRHRGRARLADGRPRGRARPSTRTPPQPGEATPRGRRTSRVDRRRPARAVVDDVELRRARRRDPRHRRRAGQRPDRADRGDHRPRRPRRAGSITLDGSELAGHSVTRRSSTPASASSPRTARTTASSARFSVAENLVLDLLRRDRRSPAGVALTPAAIRANADDAHRRSSTSAPRAPTTPAGTLSGGNQQKVVLARELSRPLRLLVASQPTRGVDVGSIEFVHTRIVAERDAGTAVHRRLAPSSTRSLALADRIAVMYRGTIVGIVPAGHPPRRARPDDGRRARTTRRWRRPPTGSALERPTATQGSPARSAAPATAAPPAQTAARHRREPEADAAARGDR